LGGQQSGEAHLSAREQEHVARMTGTPLISMAGNRNAPQPDGGLIGAIEAREREKQQMRQGYSSQAVQQAINARQQQQAMQNFQLPMPSPALPPPSGMYSNLGRQSPGPQQGYGFPQALPSPSLHGGAGWASPGGAYGSPWQGSFPSPGPIPQQGQLSPQYASPGQSPRTAQQPGRPGFNSPHQGHAF
jgi:CCR4-NOT transcriptional complex subunit CAF120